MKQRALRLKEMPPDNSEISAIIAEMKYLFARLPPPSECNKLANILSVLDKKRFDLCVCKNKLVATPRTCQFTIVLKPKPWLLNAMKALRILAANENRKVKRRR